MGCSVTEQSKFTKRRQVGSPRKSLPRSGHTQAAATRSLSRSLAFPRVALVSRPTYLQPGTQPWSQAPLPKGCSCGPLTLRFQQADVLGASRTAPGGLNKRILCRALRRLRAAAAAAESLELNGEEIRAGEEGFPASLLPTSSGLELEPEGRRLAREIALLCVAGSRH